MGSLMWLFQFLLYFSQYQLVFSSLSLLSFSSSAHPLCHHDQRSTLLQFKHMFTINERASSICDHKYGIPSYPKTMSWDENATDCCNWDGVTCDGLTGHVIGLDLSCSQLYGTIHPNSSLFQLSHLQWLNLANNHFNKSRISFAFGSFASLTHLNLSFSAFSGSIPSEISHLSKLISLDLSSSRLRLEPLHFTNLLKNLTRLQELILVSVNIYSSLPESLTNLSSLSALDLSSSGLQGNLPDTVFHLPNLQRLVLYWNFDLDINLPKSTWGSGSSLNELDLSSTNLTGELPDSIGYVKSLEYLRIKSTSLSGKLPDSIGFLKSLNYLILSCCELRGFIPKSLGNLTQIRELDLSSNNFSGEISSAVGKLNSLTLLNFSHNSLTGHIPESLGDLASLESLDISSNDLTGRIPSQLTSLTYIAVLNLSCNRLHGPIPRGKQFDTFDNSSYAGNSRLCGVPLPKECQDNRIEVQPPVSQQEEDDPIFEGFTWKIVAIGYGCGMTLGLLIGYLMFLIGRPRFFVKLFERKLSKKVVRLRRTIWDQKRLRRTVGDTVTSRN